MEIKQIEAEIKELKAAAYDRLALANKCQDELRQINQRIQELTKELSLGKGKPVKGKKDKPAKKKK